MFYDKARPRPAAVNIGTALLEQSSATPKLAIAAVKPTETATVSRIHRKETAGRARETGAVELL